MMQALGNQGNVVSARGRELTRKVFGEDLTPIQVVEKVCADVASKGIQAALHYTKQFDQAEINPASLRVSEPELQSAHRNAKPALLEAVRRIRQNVLAFQSQLLQKDSVLSLADKGELRLRLRPIRRVGIHIPGGAAAYPSTLLMTVVPAQAAGVAELAVIMPPTANGANSPDMLAVCHELGVKEVYRIGGAQGIAALAYGMEGLPRVDMIVGPGNMFVALAKKTVYGQVSIDCIAGPSEVVVLADENADPVHLAAELISPGRAFTRFKPACYVEP
jgi:histidinol dehydrogenase